MRSIPLLLLAYIIAFSDVTLDRIFIAGLLCIASLYFFWKTENNIIRVLQVIHDWYVAHRYK